MNPCRDAVASGYLQRLHRACLPVLLAEMNDEQVRQDWVGTAVAQAGEGLQREVIRRGFGTISPARCRRWACGSTTSMPARSASR